MMAMLSMFGIRTMHKYAELTYSHDALLLIQAQKLIGQDWIWTVAYRNAAWIKKKKKKEKVSRENWAVEAQNCGKHW